MKLKKTSTMNIDGMVMVIACGLHNFRVDHRKKPLKL